MLGAGRAAERLTQHAAGLLEPTRLGRTRLRAAGQDGVVPAPLAQRFQLARHDPGLAVLEGFHALKHAVRFGADVVELATTDPDAVAALAGALAPDIAAALAGATVVEPEMLASLAPRAPRTGVMAIAKRPAVDVSAVFADPAERPVVLLEDPRTMGNVGACVRVAAGAGAAGVLTTGTADPWHPDALRGAAGLQFALPVACLESADLLARGRAHARELLAIDPDGDDLALGDLPPRAVLAFGTERHGLSEELLAAAGRRVRIPMEPGVSSLNLATSVAAVLYAWRLGRS